MRTFILSMVLLSLVACSKKEKEKAETKKPPVEKTEKPPVEKTETPPPPDEVVKLDGFQTPESILYDEVNDVYLVSNINGNPADKDDNGAIAKVSPPPGSKVLNPAWISGAQDKVTLNAPKGMAILSGTLYVSDIDTVRMFDAISGAPKGEVKLPGATFVNDLAASKDTIYASDTALDKNFKPGAGQAIWAIKDGKAKKLAKGMELGAPNGLLVQGDDLWVVTFASGELYKLTPAGKRESVEKLPSAKLDGIVAGPQKTLLISSWDGKTIFQGVPGTWNKTGDEDVSSPADIGYDTKRNLLLVPVFTENRIEIRPAPMTVAGAMTDEEMAKGATPDGKLPEPAAKPTEKPATP